MLPLLDTLRTEHFKEIMGFTPLVPMIREFLERKAA